MDQTEAPLKTVVRTFEVLDILERQRGAGPTTVADEMGVNRSTAHDYLRSLEKTGYVVNEGGSYQIGYRFLQRGSRLKYRNQFFHAAKEPMEKLSTQLNVTTQIGKEESGEWVLIDSYGERLSMNMGTYPGFRTDLHVNAAGKVLLANFQGETVERIIENQELAPYTEHTITDKKTLRKELQQISQQGYAVDWNEAAIGIGFVACPVLNGDKVLGSVSVGCPTSRLKRESYRETLIEEIQAVAEGISVSVRYS